MKFYVVLGAFFLTTLAQSASEIRCAFDVGSGSTKIRVAEIEPDLQKLTKLLFSASKAVPFADELDKDGKIPAATIEKGVDAIQKLQSDAKKAVGKELKCHGVATAVFRDAKNGKDAVDALSAATKVKIVVISQETEAQIGFFSALANSPAEKAKPEELVVWDIGGKSMQMIAMNPKYKDGDKDHPRFLIYKGDVASVGMKNHILKLQNKGADVKSPNPITKEFAEKGVQFAKTEAAKVEETLAKLIQAPKAIVLGIGGVLSKSLVAQTGVEKAAITEKVLRETLSKRWDLTDKEIGGKYADTDVSNLILVLGYMEQLKMPEFMPVDANLTDGVLINPEYWR